MAIFFSKLLSWTWKDNTRNAVHGSDSVLSANREISFFFPQMITEPISTGNAAREYLEQNVTPIWVPNYKFLKFVLISHRKILVSSKKTLNDALAKLSKEKPENPVNWLADYLEKNNPNKPEIQFVWYREHLKLYFVIINIFFYNLCLYYCIP